MIMAERQRESERERESLLKIYGCFPPENRLLNNSTLRKVAEEIGEQGIRVTAKIM